jgi:hypothetical protein
MTPDEHYREAERLLDNANRYPSASWPELTGEYKADLLAEAQVHATLATIYRSTERLK